MADEKNNQVVEATPAERVMKLEGPERQSWLETGKLPEPAAEATTQADSSTDSPEKAAATETQKIEHQETTRKPSRSERRIAELLNENKRLKAEAEASAVKVVKEKVDDVDVRETKPAEVKSDDNKKPVLADYKTYEDWVEAVSDYKADQKINARLEQDRQARETAAKATEVETKNKAIENSWMERVNKAKERHSDYESVAFAKENTKDIIPGSVLDGWLLDSDHGAELLYQLASNPEEIIRINGLSAFAAARELTKMEASFEKAPASKVNAVTKAPKPPSEVGGTGTVTDDPVEAALSRGNFRAYAEEQNRRELKQSRKG
jgi:hypothetical protein